MRNRCVKSLQMKNVTSVVVKCVNKLSCSFEKARILQIAERGELTLEGTSLYRSALVFLRESRSLIPRRQGPRV